MKNISDLLITLLLAAFMAFMAGCGGKNDKEINRDRDKPRPEEPNAGLKIEGCVPERLIAGNAPLRLGWLVDFDRNSSSPESGELPR